MATPAREGGAGGGRERDNRRASISSNKPSHKKPLNTTTATTATTTTTKPLPNYLKPTFSSRLDPRRPAAAVDRRRSLDTRHNKMPRASSSSTSSKPTGPQRSFSTLSSRSAKPAAAPSIRRSLSTRVPPVAALRKPAKKSGPKSVTSDSCLEIEARDMDPLDHMIGSQDDQDEVLSLPEISEMPGQEEQLGDPVMIEEDHLVRNEEKEIAEASKEKIDDDDELDEESSSVEASGGGVVEESANVEEKHVVVELEQDESPAKEDISTTQSGNKKEAQDYNEVIEETASKLMQNKRNKVRALAGAFETVISLQDP